MTKNTHRRRSKKQKNRSKKQLGGGEEDCNVKQLPKCLTKQE